MEVLEFLFRAAELIAAIVGIIYIRKYRVDILIRYFVYFLCLNFLIELFGKLPYLIDKTESLSFLKNTFLARNAWLYNIYTVLGYLFYITFFKLHLFSKGFRNILNILSIIFFISSLLNLLLTDVFFKIHSFFPMIIGTLTLLISVFFYFFEMLKSEKILKFNKDLVFYIAVGALVFHLCAPPLFIFTSYYSNLISAEFVKIRMIILYSAIIFMYTCYTIGFVICIPQKKLYQKNKSY